MKNEQNQNTRQIMTRIINNSKIIYNQTILDENKTTKRVLHCVIKESFSDTSFSDLIISPIVEIVMQKFHTFSVNIIFNK